MDLKVENHEFINCTRGDNGDFPSETSREDFNIVTQILLTRCSKKDDAYGANPIRSKIVAFIPVCEFQTGRVIQDIKKCLGFINTSQYPQDYYKIAGEIGCVGHAHIVMSTMTEPRKNSSALGKDVYQIVVAAFNCIPENGDPLGVIEHDSHLVILHCTLGNKEI